MKRLLIILALCMLGAVTYRPDAYFGLSSDTKPAGAANGSRFWEEDTNKWYVKEGGSWVDWTPAGSTPGDTVVSETSFDQGSTAGTADELSRKDHTHGTPSDPVVSHQTVTVSVHGFDASGNAPPKAHGSSVHTGTTATWGQIDKTGSNIADIATRSHESLTSIGTNTHGQIDTALTALYNNLSTGLKTGGTVTVTPGQPSKFNMTAGTGVVVNNYTDPDNPVFTPVAWPERTAQTLTYLASADETAIGINSSGNIVQSNTPFDETDWHSTIQIATIGHWSRSQIDYIIMEPIRLMDPMTQLQGFWAAFGPFSMGGNEFTANGANMKLNKSGGSVFYQGGGSLMTPNTISSTSGSAVYFSYYYQSSPGVWVETSLTQNIDDLKYDSGSGLSTVPVGKFTIQTIFFYAPLWVNGGSNEYSVDIQYGQAVYDTMDQAKAAITSSIKFNDYLAYDVFRTWLIVKRGTSSLQSASDALFIQAPPLKFGTMAATGGGSTGEANTVSNVGLAGQGLYDTKVGVDLQFHNINTVTPGMLVTLNTTSHTLDISAVLAQTEAGAANNFLTGYSAATGTFSKSQPLFSSLSGSVSSPQLIPPTASALGAVKGTGSALTCSGTNKATGFDANGALQCGTDQTGGVSLTAYEFDFGSRSKWSKTVTVTDATVSPTSKVVVWQTGLAATGRQADEAEMDMISCRAVPGSGSFKLTCSCERSITHGKFSMAYTVN